MAIENSAEVLNFVPEMSTDSICVGENDTLCLTDHLEAMEEDIASKAPMSHSHGEFLTEDDAVATFAMANHTHSSYLTEDDAVAAFAMAEHTHTGYAASEHTHSDLDEAIEGLDTGKANATHTHAQADVAGLVDKLAEIDEAIEALQAGGASGGAPAPMLTLSMHLGKLDNNSGAEVSSSTRICSDPFAVQNGQSYWQVNDKGVNMYVLLYDADEVFLAYLGNFASGAEIAVNTEGAAYMRLGSTLGEYDLNNNFYIYDTDPAGGAVEEEEGFTQADADLLYAPIDHTHDGFAAAEHTHTAADITGLPSSVDAYSKTEADNRFAPATHNHGEYLTDAEAVDAFAPATHTHTADEITGLPASVDAYSKTEVNTMMSGKADTGHTHTASEVGAAPAAHTHTASAIGAAPASHSHSEYAASNHGHSGYASSSHTHSGYASSGHTHTASAVGALPSSGGTVSGDLTVTGTVIANGVLNTQTIQPKDSGSYSIGTSDKRYYSTYLKVNPNVSSDRRCKRDIATMDVEALAAFVDKLSVVSYNYNDDAADEVKRIGLIAQDVVAADPAIAVGCIEQDANGFYSLRAADLVFPLIAKVQALTKRVEELEGK